jgi:NADPH:quinone reductase-like Zn-dependent oxidoreductase
MHMHHIWYLAIAAASLHHRSNGMQIVALNSFGGPEVLTVQSVPTPSPRPDQVRVRVSYATVNPTDLLLRSGAQERALESASGPWVPGMELAGVVDALGADCADSGLSVGDAVIGLVNPRRREGGAYATFICLSPLSLAVWPDSIPAPEAATLPMNGVTAVMAMEALELSAGDSVLVTGGAGALGGYTIQLARAAGLVVVAHGRERDEQVMGELGATHVVSGDEPLPTAVHRLFPQGVDAVVDTAVLGGQAEAAVKDKGVAVHVRPVSDDADPRLKHRVVSVTKRVDDKAALERVVAWAEEGVLTPRLARVLGMNQAPEAHRLVERGGLRGRIVLDLREVSEHPI